MRFVLSAVGVVLDTIRYHYADFQGRTGRREYWTFTFVIFIAMQGLSGLDRLWGTTFDAASQGAIAWFFDGWLDGFFAVCTTVPVTAISVRRLHDVGRSGWLVLLPFVPVVGMLYYLFLMLSNSQPGANQYGPHPGRRVDDTDASNERGSVRSSSLQLHVERV